MKLSTLSEKQLAAVVAGAGLIGGVVSSLIGVFLVDARTDRQTDVQLVQLAVGVLSQPLPEGPGVETPETALREWAVDTINAAAEVKFDEEARALLVSGDVLLSFEEAIVRERQIFQRLRQTPPDPQPKGDPAAP